MTTARDLALVALDAAQGRDVEQGDLSLALAGAEAIDLVGAGALALTEDRLVPGPPTRTGDRLLDEAAAALVRDEPFETVEDWLWRRGNGLAAAYVEELESAGPGTRGRGRRKPLLGRRVDVDPEARARAEERRASGDPVLAVLVAAAGAADEDPEADREIGDDAVTAVLAAVGNAVMELEAVRQRKEIEDAAFDNVWRGF
ncbi:MULTISPECIES: GPP34 family phosphoprotein [unclassified Streptomyces]|uniref:GOLPH3/VPS74 family protein n=1 Tax=unclassified Streptomyces TaxID=2593676 RepID=UPI000DB968B7|nr:MULTISPECIES: GPP34 family phosphoprotein [unclassified Streptomyces]MYT73567.1 GPP34 family phosphoprotein [Streptomyces sp. SID8367]RAJ85104.1 Golgi phosphoprotein 3 GPP34 [Streptomyces sp. PsTaAH-137]